MNFKEGSGGIDRPNPVAPHLSDMGMGASGSGGPKYTGSYSLIAACYCA